MASDKLLLLLLAFLTWIQQAATSAAVNRTLPLPEFQLLKQFYPGYRHEGGKYNKHHLIKMVACDTKCQKILLHDTSALRLSYALNQVSGVHSLGKQLIRLSTYGQDSVTGAENFQYIYHPIAYGPYLADKYGYPTVSKLHATDPIHTMKKFYNKQGILRIITYTKVGNKPKGHVALWDCNHFHQSKNWMAGHELVTVEFWESPDSDCSTAEKTNANWEYYYQKADPSDIGSVEGKSLRHKIHNKHKGSQRYQHLLRIIHRKQEKDRTHHQQQRLVS